MRSVWETPRSSASMYLPGEFPWDVHMLRKEDFAVIEAPKKRDAYVKDTAAELRVHLKTVSRVLRRGSAPSGARRRRSHMCSRLRLAPVSMRRLQRTVRPA